MKTLPLLPALLLCTFASAATVECTFNDSEGNPIKRVEVRLVPDAGEKPVYEKSDGKGRVEFKGLGEGGYKLEAQREGYVFLQLQLEVAGDLALERTMLEQEEFLRMQDEALAAVRARQLDTARDRFSILVELYPCLAALHDNLARINADMGNEEEAMKHAGDAVVLEPKREGLKTEIESVLVNNAAHDALKAEDYIAAQAKFERLTELRPDSATAWHGLAICHGKQDRNKEALAAINRALELEPGNKLMVDLKSAVEHNLSMEK